MWEAQWLRGAPAMTRRLWGGQRVGALPACFTVAGKTVYSVMALPSHLLSLPFFSDKV